MPCLPGLDTKPKWVASRAALARAWPYSTRLVCSVAGGDCEHACRPLGKWRRRGVEWNGMPMPRRGRALAVAGID